LTPKSDEKLENCFDEQKLQLHCKMFLEITNIRKMLVHCLKDAIFTRQSRDRRSYTRIPVKFIRVFLTIPISTFKQKIIFLFKTFKKLSIDLRSTMKQKSKSYCTFIEKWSIS